ncbi:unnamed protein product [Bursaphelenchus okinawaensis]|uniref:protein-tyrosine-phosphatase n=1 Tax=Bursaphelenchus okinawaensis TaxID=465554 RepID=A0A811K8U7_9BILA|nr:unnamed protein product [Bursaphelenchus okinawaensis]CAG9096178.1 unnamed protein product [Bursaphelenchus okinawaensis]
MISNADSFSISPRALTADELGVPACADNNDCVAGGICVKDDTNVGRCMCSSSCPLNIPVQCLSQNENSCINMGDSYMRKYDFHLPVCYANRCICPPIFEPIPIQPPVPGLKAMLPMKCDKRDLSAMIVASPSDSAYKGTQTTIFCCINLDPRGYIPENGVYFVQNGTRKREASSSPYENFSRDIDTLFTVPTCWALTITNVQPSDSGTYQCIVQPMSAKFKTVNTIMEFVVKKHRRFRRQRIVAYHQVVPPRMIQNVTIQPNATTALIQWDMSEGPMLKIDLELFRRTDRKTRVWRKTNAKSPVLIERLNPATPYTLFVTVIDGQTEPFRLTEQFQTDENISDPPVLEDIRLINAENGRSQMCEVEWKPPRWPRGHITKYYVKVDGKVRYQAGDGKEVVGPHHPSGIDSCSNYDGDEDNFIDPQNFHNFFACKYGPLKPNRNYSATIWAENKAGKSEAVTFHEQCVMDYAEPEFIRPPETLSRTNTSSFGLEFPQAPDETNGPIACYYLAIVPLQSNISVDALPPPEQIVMDTYDKVLQNNIHTAYHPNNRFFAYIAESYMQYPKQTVVGDGDTRGGVDPCNVLYLTRYQPNDAALAPDLKYTGFMIVRVDRDNNLQKAVDTEDSRRYRPIMSSISPADLLITAPLNGQRPRNGYRKNDDMGRWRRQLSSSDPAYGFSGYFKPVILQPQNSAGNGWFELTLIILAVLLLVLFAVVIVLYMLHKRGIIKAFCPAIKKEHQRIRNVFNPIPVDDLATEYMIKHKDSDFLFNAEFEALPRAKNLPHTASEKQENKSKNRYNDIKACDITRVKLSQINEIPGSDYVNGNFVKGYNDRKTFIATQGPLENTVTDFWRMIYEHNCRIIIMVTNLRERGREQCAKYWPDDDSDEPLLVGNMYEVHTLDTNLYADYTMRELRLQPLPPSSPTIHHSKSFSRDGPSSPLLDSSYSRGSINLDSSQRTPSRLANRSDSMSSPSPKPDADYANLPRRPGSTNSNRSSQRHAPTEPMKVLQFHFTAWSDYKAPECTVSLLRLMYKLRKMDEYNRYPVVVHCSAGVGRTGTFIAIDYIMDQCKAEGKADIFGCISKLRMQRNLMVQSLEQYVFIYKALAEYQLYGISDEHVDDFLTHYQKLRSPVNKRERHLSMTEQKINDEGKSNGVVSSQNGTTYVRIDPKGNEKTVYFERNKANGQNGVGALFNQKFKQLRSGSMAVVDNSKPSLLDEEYTRLQQNIEKPRSTQWAHKSEHSGRNRFDDAVPYDSNRVILAPLLEYPNTYINASNVKGYFYPFVLAQDPMGPETAFDFWRMVNDQNSCTIVMLSPDESFTPKEKYWPFSPLTTEYLGLKQELVLQLRSEIKYTNYIERKLSYLFKSDRQNSMGREVTQFAYRHWPLGAPTPSDTASFLDLIASVLEHQSSFSDPGPIILHCRDGSYESGVFCAISLLLERLRAEKMVDVFQTVKTLQNQRPKMLTRMEQYSFCYDCVADYLETAYH